MANAPKNNGSDCDDTDEPLGCRESISDWSNGHDGGVAAGLECDEQQNPNENNGNDADRECNEKPNAPGRLWGHILKGDEILRGRDGGSSATHVGGKGNAEEKGFSHI